MSNINSVNSQGSELINNQRRSPHRDISGNVTGVVDHSSFALLIESGLGVPSQCFRSQVDTWYLSFIVFVGGNSPHIKKRSNSTYHERETNRLCGIIRVRYSQCMRLFSRSSRQKFGRFINSHVIHAALHRAKQVMVKVRYVYGLVDHQVELPPGRGINIADDTADSLISVCSEGCRRIP